MNTNHAIYPDGYAQNLRTAVANHLGVKETAIDIWKWFR